MSTRLRVAVPSTQTGNVIRDSALGRVPETVDPLIELNSRVWHTSAVAKSLLEIVRLRNARTVNCVFCKSVRYDVARQEGLTEDRVAMIADGYQASALEPREKLAIALADAYLDFPAGVDARLAARLAAEFTPVELASLLVALVSFNMTSRCAVSLGGMPDELPVMEVSLRQSTG
jgi:alkylhydroperoxidase family enzyme